VISDEERNERERLQRKGSMEWERIKLPKTTLYHTDDPGRIWIGIAQIVPMSDDFELFWRTKDAEYFVYRSLGSHGGMPSRTDSKYVYEKMTSSFSEWYITDAQKEELQEEDAGLALGH